MTRLALFVLACSNIASFAQYGTAVPGELPPAAMPQDRSSDAYAIYSYLLPLGETAAWKATVYAVRDVTVTAIPPGSPCMVPPANTALERARSGTMNPHTAVTPRAEDKQDFEEILTDFDSHCHDRYPLDPGAWSAKLPVRLLNSAEQQRFMETRSSRPTKDDPFAGAASLYAFSPVYFNAHHTAALVYATHWCGGLCGQGFWVALRKENGTWRRLNWSAISWIS